MAPVQAIWEGRVSLFEGVAKSAVTVCKKAQKQKGKQTVKNSRKLPGFVKTVYLQQL